MTFSDVPSRRPVIQVLPAPFAWIAIDAGQVTLRTDEADKMESYLKQDTTFDVPAFQIAKYPLTNAQFAPFIQAGGYIEDRWWTPAGLKARQDNKWAEPGFWNDSKWNQPTHPVVGVSWFEAMAYCAWLAELTGEPVRLPTEQEWQRAAQGGDGREYPWGNGFDKAKCNTNESGIGRTTPVDQYPNGAAPFGVMDMAGNVWEWCLNEYQSGAVNIDSVAARGVRGAGWYEEGIYARASFRSRWYPDYQEVSQGLRLVVGRPVSS